MSQIRKYLFSNIAKWGQNHHVLEVLLTLLITASVVAGILTYSFFARIFPKNADERYIIILLNIDLFLLISVFILLIRKVFKLWAFRRKNGFGNRLHLRMVLLFAIVAATPTMIVATFSATFFNIGLQSWFSNQVKTAVSDSLDVAEAYAKEKRQELAKDIVSINSDFTKNWDAMRENATVMNSLLGIRASERNLDEAIIFNKKGKVIAKAGYTLALTFEEIPFWALLEADKGGVAILSNENSDRMRALMKIRIKDDMYILVGNFISSKIYGHIDRAKSAVSRYETLENSRINIEITFYAIFIIVALLLILASIWAGINFSIRLTRPLSALIDAAEQIRLGKTDVKVLETKGDDEISVLNRTFNRMSQDIASQRGDLITKNTELNARRHFIEAVLAGVSAGVISVDADNKIKLANLSACSLLDTDLNQHKGEDLSEVIPPFNEIFDEIKNTNLHSTKKYIKTYNGKRYKNFTVNLSSEYSNDLIYGYVYTFDDITPLETAQRKAAWSDVARRIAHEIKNPLTPISLSAERLKIKYLKQIEKDKGAFETCIETIIHQVENIGKMVDEFSAFSRMPLPVIKPANFKNIIRQSIFLNKSANPEIKYISNMPDDTVTLSCDEGQISHLMTNILKNAAEAIIEKGEKEGVIEIDLTNSDKEVVIEITDNGIGLKDQSMEQISEPYYTTKEKGTGLGLAIVKKIVEDHNGVFNIIGTVDKKTLVTIKIPHSTKDENGK